MFLRRMLCHYVCSLQYYGHADARNYKLTSMYIHEFIMKFTLTEIYVHLPR